ncbi:hypothetical protein CGLO_08048 [Colletotrichum gloeosporioides Cg-14]|uniref:Uncharacterized protein n=1 Tax=Colletotrichum gloeosporioides (strain Cg-14) TaxID=1237896 RepID=T0K9V5_COLGC|nr:hypothetical protein CGLO_08048 [Colletotrichum gloeosporioides Cg-14]
MSLPGTWLHNC